MKLYYDLHIHSCLSPCGDSDMTPNNIVNMAVLQGLDVIAVSDHNSAKNLPAVREVAERNKILLIPAIEVCSAEEVHLLCLFESFDECYRFSDMLAEHLPEVQNNPEIFGEQQIMNSIDEQVGTMDKLLINGIDLSIDQLVEEIKSYGGHIVPAHVEKTAYSIISNLGFIPVEYGFTCLEVNHPPFDAGIKAKVITNSDAHYLENIHGQDYSLEVTEKSVKGVLAALL